VPIVVRVMVGSGCCIVGGIGLVLARCGRSVAGLALCTPCRSNELAMNSLQDYANRLVVRNCDVIHLTVREWEPAPGMITVANPFGYEKQQRRNGDEKKEPGPR